MKIWHAVQVVSRHECRGNLTATVPGQSLYKAPQTYLAQHPTAPPEEQVITTDPENVLLRVLKLSQKREGPKGKSDKGKAVDRSKRYGALHCLSDALYQVLHSGGTCNAGRRLRPRRVPLSAKSIMHSQKQEVSSFCAIVDNYKATSLLTWSCCAHAS